METGETENDELNDPESVNFTGEPSKTPEEIDFERPMWLVEIFYSSDITQHIVNADSEEEAVNNAVAQAKSLGEPVFTFDRIEIAALENMKEAGGEE